MVCNMFCKNDAIESRTRHELAVQESVFACNDE